MKDLIERLESAEAGSRELSDEVMLALGWAPLAEWSRIWVRPDGARFMAGALPSPTESVDDALALAGDDARDLSLHRSRRSQHTWEHWTLWQARLSLETPEEDPDETGPEGIGCAATPALALCAAILKATTHG